jgi:hypothetical protein
MHGVTQRETWGNIHSKHTWGNMHAQGHIHMGGQISMGVWGIMYICTGGIDEYPNVFYLMHINSEFMAHCIY